MSDPELIIVPILVAVPAAVMVVRMWLRHREKMAALGHTPVPGEQTTMIDARLARVEQAVEAIAIEMERVGEGQRFLTKILAERNPPLPDGSAPRGGRVITPH